MERILSLFRKMTCAFRFKDSFYSLLENNGAAHQPNGFLSVEAFVKTDNSYNFRWKRLSYDKRQMIQHDIETHNRLLLARRIILYSIVTLVLTSFVLFGFLSQMEGVALW